jgi:hypothetical protein
MNDLTTPETVTVQELARRLGCNPETIKGHVREIFPGLMQNGKATPLDEKQITIILEKMKRGSAFAHNVTGGDVEAYNSGIAGTETALTPALRLEMLYHQIDEIKTSEIARLKLDREALQIRLSEAREWYSVKRVLIETGREYSWKPLKEHSTRYGFAVEKAFDTNYGEVNVYHRDVWHAVYGLELGGGEGD